MLAFFVSLAFVQYWTVLGLAVARFLPAHLRRNDADLLIAPALGLAFTLVPTFWLSRLGLPVQDFAVWFVVISLTISGTLLIHRMARQEFRLLAVRYARTMPFIILAVLSVSWPIFVHGFDWLGTLDDDMTNDVLGAQRFVTTGYFGLSSLASQLNGSDIPGMYWLVHATNLGARSGNHLMLALWIAITRHTGFQLIGGFLAALQASLIGATAALAALKFGRRPSIYCVIVLCAVNPLFGTGAVLQLSAQIGGVTLLIAGLFSVSDVWDTANTRGAVYRAIVCAVIFAALLIWYPEVWPIFAGSAALYLAVNFSNWFRNRYFFIIVALSIALFLVFLNTYLIDSIVMVLGQVSRGSSGNADLNRIFFQFLKPDGIEKFWGLQSLYAVSSTLSPIGLSISLFLTLLLLVILFRQLRRRELTGCVLGTMCALGGLLASNQAGFGLFKWAMIVQPFVVAAVARELDFMVGRVNPRTSTRRWHWVVYASLVLPWIFVQESTQFGQVLSYSLDTVKNSISSLRGASAANLTTNLLAVESATPKPPHYVLDMPFNPGARIASVYTRGVPLIPVSLCVPFPSTDVRCRLFDPKMAGNETQRRMIKTYAGAVKDTHLSWASGQPDDLEEAPPQQLTLGPDDILLPMVWNYSPLNHSYPQLGSNNAFSGILLSKIVNYLALIITPASETDSFNLILPGIREYEPDIFLSMIAIIDFRRPPSAMISRHRWGSLGEVLRIYSAHSSRWSI